MTPRFLQNAMVFCSGVATTVGATGLFFGFEEVAMYSVAVVALCVLNYKFVQDSFQLRPPTYFMHNDEQKYTYTMASILIDLKNPAKAAKQIYEKIEIGAKYMSDEEFNALRDFYMSTLTKIKELDPDYAKKLSDEYTELLSVRAALKGEKE